jgi:ArsR family transcriptional regulator
VETGSEVADPVVPVARCVPVTSEGMTSHEAEVAAALFKALADPNRVRVVDLLATEGRAVCVCDLVAYLGLSQPTVSFHMKKLVDAGVLDREQRGAWAYYTLNDRAARRLGDVMRSEGGSR